MTEHNTSEATKVQALKDARRAVKAYQKRHPTGNWAKTTEPTEEADWTPLGTINGGS